MIVLREIASLPLLLPVFTPRSDVLWKCKASRGGFFFTTRRSNEFSIVEKRLTCTKHSNGLTKKAWPRKDGGWRRRRGKGSFLKAGRLLFRCHVELDLIPFCSTLLERKQYTPSVDRSVFQPSAFLSLSLSARFHFFYKRRVIIFHRPPLPGLALWMKGKREREEFSRYRENLPSTHFAPATRSKG